MKSEQSVQQTMFHYFERSENNPPLRDAIEFYKHDQNWSNRLIAGDSLLIMNSLLEKEGMESKVQMIYIDPPYGIKYGSNFQPFVNKLDVKDGKDEDLTHEPEMIKAFRDTWELGIHSYLTYLRDRLLLVKELLTENGSVFVQISNENVHHVKEIMAEIFGVENFIDIIPFWKTTGLQQRFLASVCDYIVWFAKDKKKAKYHQLYIEKKIGEDGSGTYKTVELANGDTRPISKEEMLNNSIPSGTRLFAISDLQSQGNPIVEYEYEGEKYSGRWKTNLKGMDTLAKANRIVKGITSLGYKRYFDDFLMSPITHLWKDTGTSGNYKMYVVQTNHKVIQRCMLMTTDPGDIVLDPTCGSGTTAYVAEKWGRRWITCDTSRIAITLSRQRLLTSIYDYFELAHLEHGLKNGFNYRKVQHVTLGSITKNEIPVEETLYDQPVIDKSKTRISGPFTVEAVPSPVVKSIDVLSQEYSTISLPTHQQQWREEIAKTGIRGKGNQKIEFSTVQIHPATKWLHADAETREKNPKRVMISFGPEHAPLEQRQVELAIKEALTLVPKPKMIIFVAMQFDPEAAKDIDELRWHDGTILKVEMNKDLLTKDLKKKRLSNESFWLMGQPDVELKNTDKKYTVIVKGFDYYNTKTGEVESGESSKIAMWMLDTDYDGRSVYPQQVFFPMETKAGDWDKLAKTLQAQIDQTLIAKYQGTKSIPFEAGPNKRIAVKIIDDRGIESLKIIKIE